MKYYVIADVHGFYDEMITALSEAGFFEDSTPNKLILLGDAFDRGSKPKEIVEFLMKLKEENRLIYVLGNHEDLFVSCIQEIASNKSPKSEYDYNGTIDTILALSDFSYEDIAKYPTEIARNILKTDLYRHLLPLGLDYYETENYVFVHGFIPCDTKGIDPITEYIKIEDWRNASPSDWKKSKNLNGIDGVCKFGIRENGKTIVCGHWQSYYGQRV